MHLASLSGQAIISLKFATLPWYKSLIVAFQLTTQDSQTLVETEKEKPAKEPVEQLLAKQEPGGVERISTLRMEEKEDKKARLFAAITLAGLMVFALMVLPAKTPSAPSLSQSHLIFTEIKSAPIEYQLAYLDTGQLPRGTDRNAARIRYLLKSLAEKTGDSYQHIADKTSEATETLKRDYGRDVSRQRFLEEANNYYIAGAHQVNYDSVSALLIVAMGK